MGFDRSGGGMESRRRWFRLPLFLVLACLVLLSIGSPALGAVTQTGTLRQQVTDDFGAGRSTSHYSLVGPDRVTPLLPTTLTAAPGETVSVTGQMRGGVLIGSVKAVADARPDAFFGQRRVAVLLLEVDGTGAPVSAEGARSAVFTATNSANAFFQEESYGQISLTGKSRGDGDVFGPFRVGSAGGCPYRTWDQEADEAAATAGVDLDGYQDIIYAFSRQPSCFWNGASGVGANWVNINGEFRVKTLTHELGHNLGLEHAGSLSCTAGGERVQISNSCSTNEYGDPFDTMGNIATRHNSGWNLAKLGILGPKNIETVEESGTYTIHAALHPSEEITDLRIPRTRAPDNVVQSWYDLEIREKGGVFENVADATDTGVSIRATDAGASPETLLIDANPATATFNDAPLGVGETFDGGSVRVKTLAAGAGAATVSVEVDDTRDSESPSVPTDLTASVDADGVHLNWLPSSDNVGVDHYEILREGTVVGTTASTNFTDAKAPVGQHAYVVEAVDAAGNQSGASAPATVTVPAGSGPSCESGSCSLAFRFSGTATAWTVPPGVDEASLTLEGASGGPYPVAEPVSGPGGLGSEVQATLGNLTAGQSLTVTVGGEGNSAAVGGAGGFNGGGDGGLGGGGGGASSVALGPTLELLAGGGGGGGADGFEPATGQGPSGALGGSAGQRGVAGLSGGGMEAFGAILAGGHGGAAGGSGAAGGAAGAVSATSTCAGGALAGAVGAAGESFAGGGGVAAAGGGGGAGYVGGGQGGGGAHDECGDSAGAGGGGGGSSFAAAGLAAVFDGAAWRGDGQVSISYPDPIGALPHSYMTAPGDPLIVNAASGVLVGASSPEGEPVSAAVAGAPAHGTLALDGDGSFTYTPNPGFVGVDSFGYRAAGDSGNYADAEVVVRVAAPPTASILDPSPNGDYTVGQSVATTFSCGEGAGGPGLSVCEDSTGVTSTSVGHGYLDTSTIGTHIYTVTATSRDGLTVERHLAYRVDASDQGSPRVQPSTSQGEAAVPTLRVAIIGGLTPVTSRATRARLRCSGGASASSCRGILSLASHGLSLARTRYALATGATRVIPLHLSPKAVLLLAQATSNRLRADATVTVDGSRAVHRAVVLHLARRP